MTEKAAGAKVIFEQIDLLFVEYVGPIAIVLCEEAQVLWEAKLVEQKKSPSLRHIDVYLRILLEHLTEAKHRSKFVSEVYQIPALSHYKKYFTEEGL